MSEHGKQNRPMIDQNFPAKPESPKPEVEGEATPVKKSELVSPIGPERLGAPHRFIDNRPPRVKD